MLTTQCHQCRHKKGSCLQISGMVEELHRLSGIGIGDYFESTIHHCPHSDRNKPGIDDDGKTERRELRR